MFRRLQTYTYSWQFVDLEFVEKLSVPESLRVEDLLLVGVQSVHGDFWHLWPLARPILASWKGQEGSIFLYIFNFYITHTLTRHITIHPSFPWQANVTDTLHRLTQLLFRKSLCVCLSSDLPLVRGIGLVGVTPVRLQIGGYWIWTQTPNVFPRCQELVAFHYAHKCN